MRKNLAITEWQYDELLKGRNWVQSIFNGTVVGVIRIPVAQNNLTTYLYYCIVEYKDAIR